MQVLVDASDPENKLSPQDLNCWTVYERADIIKAQAG